MGILAILKQYVDPAAPTPTNAGDHFDELARQSTPADLATAVEAAFRSVKTLAFGQSVGNLFGQSNFQQQAGVLNQLLQGIGPGGLAIALGQMHS